MTDKNRNSLVSNLKSKYLPFKWKMQLLFCQHYVFSGPEFSILILLRIVLRSFLQKCEILICQCKYFLVTSPQKQFQSFHLLCLKNNFIQGINFKPLFRILFIVRFYFLYSSFSIKATSNVVWNYRCNESSSFAWWTFNIIVFRSLFSFYFFL